jgi:hypothetical protein
VSPLEKNRQHASKLLARFSQPRGLDLHVIPQDQLLAIGMKVHLLLYPVGWWIAVQVMLEPECSYVNGTIDSFERYRLTAFRDSVLLFKVE